MMDDDDDLRTGRLQEIKTTDSFVKKGQSIKIKMKPRDTCELPLFAELQDETL